jgi:hypothetical protein
LNDLRFEFENKKIIMKNYFKNSVFVLPILLFFFNCGVTKNSEDAVPANDTGSATAKLNGVAWSAAWASSIVGDFGGTKILTINIQLSEKNSTEGFAIGVSSFTGPDTYAYGGDKDKATFTAKYKGKGYMNNNLAGGGGIGTIKITEFVDSKGLLSPGKVLGEFSGTVKSIDSEEVLTITNGKFISMKYL